MGKVRLRAEVVLGMGVMLHTGTVSAQPPLWDCHLAAVPRLWSLQLRTWHNPPRAVPGSPAQGPGPQPLCCPGRVWGRLSIPSRREWLQGDCPEPRRDGESG